MFMNFLGHHEVARRILTEEDPDFMFGSMLPDFVGMFGRRRILGSVTNRRIREGIQSHQETDRLFDGHEQVKVLEAQMRASFSGFMPKWPAAQCVRAGKDMLFDGLHVGNVQANASYKRTMLAAATGSIALGGEAPDLDFWGKIQLIQAHGVPAYDDPHIVAVRLHKRLSITRINFDAELIPELTTALASHQPTIFEIGPLVMNQVIEKLRA